VTLQEMMRDARARLAHVKTEDVMRDLRLLAAHSMGVEAARLTLHLQDDVSVPVQQAFKQCVTQRAQHMPVSKIIGLRQFWGRTFEVNASVLDPRADTETLISACLADEPCGRLLDLGTGSGVIGLTLAAEWPDAKVVCTDISPLALDVARSNAQRLDFGTRVRFLHSDWFEAVEGRFDLIVSNPPYIALEEWHSLDVDVRVFDPRMALTDESDGLSAYRKIVGQADRYLSPGGRLMVEIGHRQAKNVTSLFLDAGFTQIQCLHDIAGRDRVVSGVLGE